MLYPYTNLPAGSALRYRYAHTDRNLRGCRVCYSYANLPGYRVRYGHANLPGGCAMRYFYFDLYLDSYSSGNVNINQYGIGNEYLHPDPHANLAAADIDFHADL